MAMAVRGKNKHYNWQEIQLRHWVSTAENCYFPQQDMQRIFTEVFGEMENVITKLLRKFG